MNFRTKAFHVAFATMLGMLGLWTIDVSAIAYYLQGIGFTTAKLESFMLVSVSPRIAYHFGILEVASSILYFIFISLYPESGDSNARQKRNKRNV